MNETNSVEKQFYTADEVGVPGFEVSKEGVITGIKVPFNDVLVLVLKVLLSLIAIIIAINALVLVLMALFFIVSGIVGILF